MSDIDLVAQSWDSEYRNGRYYGDRPVAFVADILRCAAASGFSPGSSDDTPR